MKNKKWIAMLAMALAFGIVGVGCSDNGSASSSTNSVADNSTLDDSSSLEVENSSSLEIEDSSSLEAENSSSLEIEDSSSLETENSSSENEEQVHIHSFEKVGEKEATYFEEGVKEHYTCDGCEEKFLLQGLRFRKNIR